MRQRRMFRSLVAYEVCFRARSGLPLPARPIVKLIIESALARTQRDNKVIICNYVWMANHPHILLVSQDVNALKNFYGELKKRITDMLKRLLGLENLHLWEDREPRVMQILDLEEAKKRIAYYFLNPVKAALVDSIDHYTGANTWHAFTTSKPSLDTTVEISAPWIRLPSIPALSNPALSPAQEGRVINQIKAANRSRESFKIQPFAWLRIFGITDPVEVATVQAEIIALVRAGEEECREQRRRDHKSVRGVAKLLLEPITVSGYKPEKTSRSIFFLSSRKELRVQFHALYQQFCRRCRECYELACLGVKEMVWPDGAFVPPIRPLVNPLGFAT